MFEDIGYDEGTRDTAQVCLNGHVVNIAFHDLPQFNEDFCAKCGEKTITACPDCAAEIPGHHRGSLGPDDGSAPAYCTRCGHAFPWTVRALAAAKELAADSQALDADERTQLQEAIEELSKDSPAAPVAVQRYKRLAQKAGTEVAGALRTILIDIVSETAKKAIWG